jgi:PAS domain S-box-containing protein
MKQWFKERLNELERQHPGAMVLLLNGAGEYVYANAQCRRVLGYAPAEVVGRPATDFAATQDISHAELALQDAMLNNESVTVNIRVRTRSGELKPVRGGAARLNDPDTGEVYLAGWVLET